jgi:uncharacterized protein (DUF1697 family)
MTVHIALLRAVNLGSHGKVAMAALRDMIGALGFANPRTLLQSGNVVFESSKAAETVEKMVEAAAAKDLGLRTDFFVRSESEWNAVVAGNPFGVEAKDDPSHLVVVVLKATPTAKQVQALQAAIKGPERVRAKAKQLYAVYPNGIGRSKLTLPLIEKMLGTRGTARNWNTVLKLAALAGER